LQKKNFLYSSKFFSILFVITKKIFTDLRDTDNYNQGGNYNGGYRQGGRSGGRGICQKSQF
jgi:hypothetical protein